MPDLQENSWVLVDGCLLPAACLTSFCSERAGLLRWTDMLEWQPSSLESLREGSLLAALLAASWRLGQQTKLRAEFFKAGCLSLSLLTEPIDSPCSLVGRLAVS
jgi:hypothetical protein